MYFGSVRFFKDLILSLIALIIVILLSLAVFFGIKSSVEHKKAVQAMAKYEEVLSQDKLNIPDGASFDEIYSALKEKGYSAQKIVEELNKIDSSAMGEVYKSNFAFDGTSASYASLYPDLYVAPPTEFKYSPKTVYLTFDDGPSDYTLDILNILQKYDIKATFFMCGSKTEKDKEIMKKVAEAGHSIGIHSLAHKYDEIYSSPEAFLKDFNATYQNIYEATGIKPNIYRFPGGSINNSNRFIYRQLIAEVTRRGFVYYDWNVSAEDADNAATWTSVYKSVTKGMENKDRAVILMHDSREVSVLTLEDLIIYLKDKGYSFDKITNETRPEIFGYK